LDYHSGKSTIKEAHMNQYKVQVLTAILVVVSFIASLKTSSSAALTSQASDQLFSITSYGTRLQAVNLTAWSADQVRPAVAANTKDSNCFRSLLAFFHYSLGDPHRG
jgi:hypothetical protein